MMRIEPRVGAQYLLDNQVYEIVSLVDDQIGLCSLVHQYRRFIGTLEFALMERQGKLHLHQRAATDISPAAQWASLPAESQGRLAHRLAYVNAYLQAGGRLSKAQICLMVAKVALKISDPCPPCPSTLWNWKQRYLLSNCSPLSLLKRPQPARQKRLPGTVEELMTHYIDTVYLKPERPTLRHAHKLLRGHVVAENRERRRCGGPLIEEPSYATFRRRVLGRDRYLVTQKRDGLKEARRRSKANAHIFIDNDPYACTLFDSKTWDVIVVDELGEPLGRPVFSAHFNPATGEVPGWDLSLGAPCAEKMLSATIRAIARYGKPATVYSDHGAEVFNSGTLNNFHTLGISGDYVPVGEPDAKAGIERFFRTVDLGFAHNLPGTTKSNPKARGDYDSTRRACLTLPQMRSALAVWIEAYETTFQDKLSNSPAGKGAELRLLAPPPERFTEAELKLMSMGIWRLRLDRGMVRKSNLTWVGPGVSEVSMRLTSTQKAIVHFNPCDLGTVWIAHPDTPEDWHPAVGTRLEYQGDLSMSDHNAVRKAFTTERRHFDHTEACLILYNLNNQIDEYIGQNNKHRKKEAKKAQRPPTALVPKTKKLTRPQDDDVDYRSYDIIKSTQYEPAK